MASIAFRRAGVRIATRLRASQRATVIPIGRDEWDAAFDLYQRRPDKEWSLSDCSSILICQARGIEEAFTADAHFEQAGLRPLLKP